MLTRSELIHFLERTDLQILQKTLFLKLWSSETLFSRAFERREIIILSEIEDWSCWFCIEHKTLTHDSFEFNTSFRNLKKLLSLSVDFLVFLNWIQIIKSESFRNNYFLLRKLIRMIFSKEYFSMLILKDEKLFFIKQIKRWMFFPVQVKEN